MAQYEKLILNRLLDSYESSTLFTGTNKVAVQIAFPFQKRTLPAYFDESSLACEEIHAAMQNLERQGLIRIEWKKGREGHIISKVVLCVEERERAYACVSRVPKADLIRQNRKLLAGLWERADTPVYRSLIGYLDDRLSRAQSVKEFIDLADPKGTEQLLAAVAGIEKNDRSCYIREFSIGLFHDSKAFEAMSGKLLRAMRMFGEDCGEKEWEEILAEYGIYHTPNYVYVKGEVTLGVGELSYRIGELRQGIGISGEDIGRITVLDAARIERVLTVENLTTFFRWDEPGTLAVYLGGYHNGVRRALLEKIHRALPDVAYDHFGDIDVGGFLIYEDLCEKTGIPFRRYRMDLEHLRRYEAYGKPLTANDRVRIEKLLAERPGVEYAKVLEYMLAAGVKLEQECMGVGY